MTPLIAQIHAAHYAHPCPEITPDTTFAELGFDGVDMTALELLIADEMGVEVGDAIERVETVGELVGMVPGEGYAYAREN